MEIKAAVGMEVLSFLQCPFTRSAFRRSFSFVKK